MTLYYSIRWENLGHRRGTDINVSQIRTTFLDTSGHETQVVRDYEQWLGVCTRDMDRVKTLLENRFPNSRPRHIHVGEKRKVLPYFADRLAKGRLDSPTKPFYKVFLNAPLEPVGQVLNKYKISYYEDSDWLVRLYIDLCDSPSQGFFYKWYTVTHHSPWLVDSFVMDREQTHLPPFTIVAFDLETVPMAKGDQRVPNGDDVADEIVMISIYKWKSTPPRNVERWLLYRPVADAVDYPDSVAHVSERSMLADFHAKIEDAHVLTGYNICGFDLGCVFARLLWLRMTSLLGHYTSSHVGQHVVTTYKQKLVLDLYPYFKTFSNYDLPSFKLDDVARVKLGGESKVPIKSTGLWSWYTQVEEARVLLAQNATAEQAHAVLRPHHVAPHQFGTFRSYMDYCLQDSCLVYQLFEKEMVLSFLVERANFTAWDAVKALYMGNSNFLLNLFKTYGTALGFFVNTRFFDESGEIPQKLAPLFKNCKTYQGALNFCIPEQAYEDVSVLDFASMYPSTLVSSNLCYSTCTIMMQDEWKACPHRDALTAIPYRMHDARDFEHPPEEDSRVFRYPSFDPERDAFAIVIHEKGEGFLPCIVRHFIELRRHHQARYRDSPDVYHYNAQLNIKILINSLYGVMANKHSCLAYLPVAMSIVTLARYQLLGSYHYIQKCGYRVCYADTDSLMVHRWPHTDATCVNHYLSLPHVQLQFEQCMKRLLVVSRKRYVYETQGGEIVTKGFQKRINDLLQCLMHEVLDRVWKTIYDLPDGRDDADVSAYSRGWIVWVDVILRAFYMSRDAKKYAITRKTKPLHAYTSTTCATVRMLQRYPEKANDYIDYTYSRADMSVREASKWVLDAEECEWVNYEQLIMSQKKMFCLLLNMAFWKHVPVPHVACQHVLNTLRWKQFMHAELLYGRDHAHRRVELLVEKGVKYTFYVNDWAKRSTRLTRTKRQRE